MTIRKKKKYYIVLESDPVILVQTRLNQIQMHPICFVVNATFWVAFKHGELLLFKQDSHYSSIRYSNDNYIVVCTNFFVKVAIE